MKGFAALIARRLSHADRRRHLLAVAREVVRLEGADRLTLGHLATRAGVSKPVVYDQFQTRSGLLIALYRLVDYERVDQFEHAMESEGLSADQTINALAQTYIECAAETDGEFQAIGAALAGSEEKAAVFQELLDNCVRMFASLLAPHSAMAPSDLDHCCIALVGAGEALAGAAVRGLLDREEAIATFAAIIAASVKAVAPAR